MVASLLDVLNQRAQYQSEKKAYIFLQNGETELTSLTYGELDKHAKSIAVYLKDWRGERALLLYPPGLEFISAFLGCLYAGVIAVPAYPPKGNQKLFRLLSIVDNAQTKLALTTSSTLPSIHKKWQEEIKLAQLALVATDTIKNFSQEFVLQSIGQESLAFLQYTSGSTGMPKGVMLTHGNLIHNLESTKQTVALTPESVSATWLPHFHDMGLIDGILQPLYTGFLGISMPPNVFIRKPLRWLQAISRYRVTHSGGPNFAYNLCVQKIKSEHRNGLDLSSWKTAYNGAEPIFARVLNQFSDFFSPCGFKSQSFYPCYGMAESTLMVTGGEVEEQPICLDVNSQALQQNQISTKENHSSSSRIIVGCGHSLPDTTVIVVDPNTLTETASNTVGEIWISSPSVARGYWNNPEATKKIFQAYLADTGAGPFLRTGDLGFFRNTELFVTGRLKDMVIIRGQNYYPQDIELTVQESHPALSVNNGAVFSIELAGEEKLVVVQELERTYRHQMNLEEVVEAIIQAVLLEHGLAIETIVLLKPGKIDKTSSGKIQRHICRQKFIDGSLSNIVFSRSLLNSDQEIKEIKFSLLYFSSNEADFADDKYQLLFEGAKFADQNNFHAVWIPERHFDPFGGLFPEPSILGAALAVKTKNVRIRAGSVVLPLQNPVRVAEQWSLVDNLSMGRVDISFARGWNPNDFVLAPESYTNRTQVMFNNIKTIQKLWRGESIYLPNGNQEKTKIKIYPLPRQSELSTWITCSGGKERFVEAGAIGANILTALLFQPIEELAEKIAIYRESRADNGYDSNSGQVTLMLHTFVSSDMEFIRSRVEQPFKEYLQSSINLWRNSSQSLDELTELEQDQLLNYAFERYFQTAALIGTPSSCLEIVKQLQKIGVDEIACLIDFGVNSSLVLENLDYLRELKELSNGNYHSNSFSKINNTKYKNSSNYIKSKNSNKDLVDANKKATKESTRKRIVESISKQIALCLEIDINIIKSNVNFLSLGIDSLKAMEIIGELEKELNLRIPITLMLEYPTIIMLSNHLLETYGREIESNLVADKEKYQQQDYIREKITKSNSIQQSCQSDFKYNQRVTGEL